jgi:GT2 family glycosyltransferase
MPFDIMKTFNDSFHCSVIIVNWNSWGILSRCLEELQQQTFHNFNIVVVDNASADPAPSDLLTQYFNVTLIQNQTNLGFAAANNQAIRLLKNTEWVVLLNPDAFPELDWLESLVGAARKNPEYAMFASRQLMDGNQNLLDGDGDVYHISGLVWRAGHGRPVSGANAQGDNSIPEDSINHTVLPLPSPPPEGDGIKASRGKVQVGHKPREIFSPCAAAAMYRRDALMAVGGFDEDFFCYIEDVDLGFRLRLMGHRCLLVPSAVVHHIGSATTGGQRSDFSVYHGHRNLVWAFVKNMPGYLFWALLPLHILMNCATICLFVLRGKGRVIIQAKLDAIKVLPLMWAKRKQIQNNRVASIKDIWRVLDKRLLPRK